MNYIHKLDKQTTHYLGHLFIYFLKIIIENKCNKARRWHKKREHSCS